MKSEEKGIKNKLPPGQRVTKKVLKWGEEHPTIAGSVPKIDPSQWKLVIKGEVETKIELGWNDLLKLPNVTSTSDFHCVEGWSVRNLKWQGIPFKSLLKKAKPDENAKFVTFTCADGYTTSLSFEELLKKEAILAYKLNGKLLEESLGAPLRLIIPDKYAYKNAMWITEITFTSQKELGYWERKGYSDTADVWKNDRFSR